MPSRDTFNRVLAALCPVPLGECFMAWTQSLRSAVTQEIVALDGKALRRALDADQNSKVIVSAGAQSNRPVLGQLKVDAKSNEITALPNLLRALELTGCIVTVDAMGTQKQLSRKPPPFVNMGRIHVGFPNIVKRCYDSARSVRLQQVSSSQNQNAPSQSPGRLKTQTNLNCPRWPVLRWCSRSES